MKPHDDARTSPWRSLNAHGVRGGGDKHQPEPQLIMLKMRFYPRTFVGNGDHEGVSV